MVVDSDLPGLRPWPSGRWRRLPTEAAGLCSTLRFPPGAWRSGSGRTIIYRFTGPVPDGFMAVDSLPPDNFRALGP
ncbi:MAG: hypothetical protein MZV70_22515 [Desulfobacterales bacterium]|nr:hypothetical protein [Desulfobacterales bacterium]